MSFPLTYQTTMTMAAELVLDSNTAAYVRERALRTLIRELSPLNERHLEVKQELGIEDGPAAARIDVGAESRAYMQGVRDGMERAEAAESTGSTGSAEAVEGEDEDEGDESSDGAAEDEPP
ncbi:MAG: hypothetical protein OXG27_14040 [Chloroflexi bacterium]|nr:hypothetical protein [Chloroflexota bacterium]